MQIAALVASSSLAGSLAGRYLDAQLRGDRREALRLVSVPTDVLVAEVERERPHALALLTAMIFHEPALRETIEEVRRAAGKRVPILVGGQALTWDPTLAQRLDVEGSCTSAIELMKTVRAMPERS